MSERELSDRSANMKIQPTYTLALALTMLLLLPGAAWSLEKVRLGYSGVGSGEEIHHFAKEVGLFSKAGLDVEIIYIPGGSTVVQAIAAGEISFRRRTGARVADTHTRRICA